MSYTVRSIFYTLQGEGANVGRPAVFCRFAHCNLWSGHEEDRSTAICKFCDTDFIDGDRYESADELARVILYQWPSQENAFVVCTGGEPLLQLDAELIAALKKRDCEIAVETNGTLQAPSGIDWITVSPKNGARLRLQSGNELKLVFPQDGLPPKTLEKLDFQHFFLQPMDGPEIKTNTKLALNYCLGNPRWRLSLQIHKLLGLP